MKTMTCSQMGGPCDAAITGNTPEETVNNGMQHLMLAHPQMAEDMQKMSKEDTDKWMAEFTTKWNAVPDVAA